MPQQPVHPPLNNASMPLKRGSRLGKYRLEKKLGTGGCSEVWKARDQVENIWVALKLPLVGKKGSRENETILREVSHIARLHHPHIMPLKNADIIDGQAVLATELSTGTLEDCSKPMAPRRIVSIILQVLEGLAYAHRQRLVHCDVTPGNIFLFPDGRAALGDFGISLHLKGRMPTMEEFGTPGYVAPEQAYGHPTYRSDCFAIALILYEYLTGCLPRWPFKWPPRGINRLREKTSLAMVKFLRQALSLDPDKRFANAEQMLSAMKAALPRYLKNQLPDIANHKAGLGPAKPHDWYTLRRQSFLNRYKKVFPTTFRCVECGEPIAESMRICPWCGSDRNRFDACSHYNYVCPRCRKGVLPEWRYCPWCYGAGFAHPSEEQTPGVRYQDRCAHCHGKLMRFMRYCPWCRHKVKSPWQVGPFPEICGRCGWSVDTEFWNHCPWCKQDLRD